MPLFLDTEASIAASDREERNWSHRTPSAACISPVQPLKPRRSRRILSAIGLSTTATRDIAVGVAVQFSCAYSTATPGIAQHRSRNRARGLVESEASNS